MLQGLVRHFETATHLPIEPVDIEVQILALKIVQQINFIPDHTMPQGVVRGVLDRYSILGPGPNEIADIYFSAPDPYWQRLISTKEMMNICDNGTQSADTQPKVSKLLDEMITPPDLYSNQTAADRNALIWALFVLFPKPLRDALLIPHGAGKLTVAEIADLAELPPRYIPWLLSDKYDLVYTALMGA